MEILNIKQGTQEWLDVRARHFTASEAPAMMAESKYQTRDQLLKLKATGEEEPVSEFTHKLFNRGHAAEAAIRPHIEKMIDAELFPATVTEVVDGVPLLASCDGLTMMGDALFEHKLWNESIAKGIEKHHIIPMFYRYQIEQQFMVTGAEKCIFVMSDGTRDKMISVVVYPEPEFQDKIIKGWKQFKADLDGYQHAPDELKPEAEVIRDLPAINIEISGGVKSSNLELYKSSAMAFIDSIKTDLATDEDFANAEKQVKFCEQAEKKLELVKGQALEQTADIADLFRTINELKDEMRKKRLTLDKTIKSRKDDIRRRVVSEATNEIQEFVSDINKRFGISLIKHDADVVAAIKGKRTVSSLKSAANDEVARAKISATELACKVEKNLSLVKEAGRDFLFSDLSEIVMKDTDDLRMLIENRINQHKEQEEARIEAEREKLRAEAEAAIAEVTEAEPVVKQEVATSTFLQKSKEVSLDVTQANIEASLIENGIGKITAKKVASLIINNKVANVTFNK